jgi:hypothetical protein
MKAVTQHISIGQPRQAANASKKAATRHFRNILVKMRSGDPSAGPGVVPDRGINQKRLLVELKR